MPKRLPCPNCGYVSAPADPVGSCIQCVQRARLATIVTPQSESTQLSMIETALVYLQDRDDGWFRVVSSLGSAGYYKWKFTSGHWEGCYILYVVPKLGDKLSGYAGLVRQLAKVDSGTLQPSPDKPY